MGEKNVNLKIIPPMKYLPVAALAVAIFLVLFFGVSAYKQFKEARYVGHGAQYQNAIAITGEGKVFAKPDIGQISLTVLSNAKTVTAAQQDNTDKMNKVTQAIKDLGVAEADLQTVSYNINPTYQYISGKSVIIGYEVSQTLQVKIRDLTKVGQILEKGATLGANQAGALSFTFDDPEKLNAEARQKAIVNAKQKAQDLAQSLGVKLGKVTSFSESVYGGPQPMYYGSTAYGIGGGGATPDVQTGQNEIDISVSLVYEIY